MTKKRRLIWTCLLALLLALINVSCQTDSRPDVDPTWSEWIKANHHEIRSLDSGDTDYSDLQFLKPLLAGRRLLGLGENGHGVAEFSRAKVRLIKFLHEEMAFDVIAFESNIFECFQADMHAADWTAEGIMGRSIFQVWHTEDVLELFRYIKESKGTSRPLILAGFDNQNSTTASLRRPAAFQMVIAKIDPDYAAEVQRTDLNFQKTIYSANWQDAYTEPYRLFYDDLRQWFDTHLEELAPLFPDSPLLPLVLRQAAWSQVREIEQTIAPYEQGGFNIRDRAMADNIDVLLERFYPGKKIMLWAHNLHLDHDPNLTGVVNWEMLSMGYWLAQRHRPFLYTIEFFMFQGEAAETNRSIYQIDPAPAGTLEAILFQTGAEFAFVDMLNQSESPGNSWMFSAINWMNSGIWTTTMIPRRQFDGIFYVETVSPPPYLRYYESPD
jgi:erythromycin esterase